MNRHLNAHLRISVGYPPQNTVLDCLNRICERYGPSDVARAIGVDCAMPYHWRKCRQEPNAAAAWRILDLDDMTEKQVRRLVAKRIKQALTGKY